MMTNVPSVPPNDKLSDQEQRFCLEYACGLPEVARNGTAAALAAGYSDKNAAQQASRLLRKAKIRREIDRLIGEQSKRIKLDADRVMEELWRLGTVDIGQAFDEKGNLKPIHEMPEALRRAVSSIETEELFEGRGEDRTQIGFTKKIKLFDKTRSLELLGKRFKLFTDVVKHEGLDDLAARLEAARKRRQANG